MHRYDKIEMLSAYIKRVVSVGTPFYHKTIMKEE